MNINRNMIHFYNNDHPEMHGTINLDDVGVDTLYLTEALTSEETEIVIKVFNDAFLRALMRKLAAVNQLAEHIKNNKQP